MDDRDVVIIGAGHNGLVCAAYLLEAGYKVLLLEARSRPGGAATTEEALPKTAPGFQFDLCAIDHEAIHLSPVVRELELTKYGLEYLACDPVLFCPQPDGTHFLAWRSLERTYREIARYSDRDARKYVEFIEYWQHLNNALAPIFNASPMAILDIAKNYDRGNWQDLWQIFGSRPKILDFLHNLITSPADLLNEWFDSETVKAPLACLAAQIGAPPSQRGIAMGAMRMAMRHDPGLFRPRGGTGALIAALVKRVEEKGGKILTGQRVERILVNDEGRASGVRVANGKEYRANLGVISNIDARRLFLDLCDRVDVDCAAPKLRHKLERRTNNNSSVLKIDLALSEAPEFIARDRHEEALMGSILIADSTHHVEKAHAFCSFGEIPEDPILYAVCPTILDPGLAPKDKHTLWLECFVPYQIARHEGIGFNGSGWTAELKEEVCDRVLAKLATYAPNILRSAIARRSESPPELEGRLGLSRGSPHHIDMTLDRMVFFRPLPELADYKTPIDGLFLTGAGTHPGGGISGMPGRNCARAFVQNQQPFLEKLTDVQNSLVSFLRSTLGIDNPPPT
ncbi:MAG: NAD(P)/FAD-dependent oxidoreductase [Cyanobacteria bacterium SBLK]|nr:NAD(P)/FAD-dependent oxidoreductase [Cyanobacteria bacterium SBLK]